MALALHVDGRDLMSNQPGRTHARSPSKGLYANYFEVGETPFEVIIDFGQHYAGKDRSVCHTRIVTSPIYAEALLRTLSEALDRHRRHTAKPSGWRAGIAKRRSH